jgi:hypothetical protein
MHVAQLYEVLSLPMSTRQYIKETHLQVHVNNKAFILPMSTGTRTETPELILEETQNKLMDRQRLSLPMPGENSLCSAMSTETPLTHV